MNKIIQEIKDIATALLGLVMVGLIIGVPIGAIAQIIRAIF